MAEAQPKDATFSEIGPARPSPGAHLSLDDLKSVHLEITVELGRCNMLVRDVLTLKRGAVVTLNKLAGEMTDVLVNGVPLAKAEVVVIGDNLHVRLAEITGAAEMTDEKQGGE
jgi:flagellar motor switch protein FliN/FliY